MRFDSFRLDTAYFAIWAFDMPQTNEATSFHDDEGRNGFDQTQVQLQETRYYQDGYQARQIIKQASRMPVGKNGKSNQ